MYRKAEIIYCPSQNDALRELLSSYNVRFTDNGNVCKFTLNADAPDSALIISSTASFFSLYNIFLLFFGAYTM